MSDLLVMILAIGTTFGLGYMQWQMIKALERGDLMGDAMAANAERAAERYREHGTYLERRAERRIGRRSALVRARRTRIEGKCR